MKKESRKRIFIETLCLFCCMMAVMLWGVYSSRPTVGIDDIDTPLAGNIPASLEVQLKSGNKIDRLEDCTFEFENWISGRYSDTDGTYQTNKKEICLKDYKSINSLSYKVVMQKWGAYLRLSEFDKNGKFIRSNFCVNGMTYTPKDEVAYVGIGVYSYDGVTNTFDKYKAKFDNGFKLVLTSNALRPVILEPEPSDEIPKVPIFSSPAPAQKSNREKYKEIVQNLVLNFDTKVVDVSDLGISYTESREIWEEIKSEEGECKKRIETCYISHLTFTNQKTKTIDTVRIDTIDDGVQGRYDRMNEVIEELKAGVDNKMTALDKVLYVHEYIVKNSTYSKEGAVTGTASCLLGDKIGRCCAFAGAMKVVLKEMGVNTYSVTSFSMGHEWNYVEIDGEMYNIDACWDNTRRSKSTGQYYHRFLLLSDNEMESMSPSHYDFYCEDNKVYTATSNKFSNWFVHDVYGQMFYYDGLWYYFDNGTKSIVCSDVYGNNRKTIVDGSNNTIKLSKMVGNKISYTIDGTWKSVYIK